jgi:hypothetical protein
VAINTLSDSLNNPGSGMRKKNFNLNFYITPRVKVVAHNTTLTGNLLAKTSEYSLNQKDVTPVLFEYDMGFNLRWSFVNFGANLSGRSKEFTFQEKTFQHWGGVYVAIICNLNK